MACQKPIDKVDKLLVLGMQRQIKKQKGSETGNQDDEPLLRSQVPVQAQTR